MILEELEVEAHQAGEFRFERTGQIIEAFVDCIAKGFEVGIVSIGLGSSRRIIFASNGKAR